MRKKAGYRLSERNIIVNSQFAKEKFPRVFSFMFSNQVLRQAEYEAIEEKALKNWLERSTIESILTQSKKEWRPVMQNGELKYEVKREQDGKCQICGTRLKYLYFIQNALNGAELCAGSECITQYGLDRKQLKEFKERVEAILKIERRQEFIEQTGGALQAIEGYQHFLTTIKMLVPQTLSDEFHSKLSALRIEARTYIDEGEKIDFSSFLEKYNDLEQLIFQIRQYEKNCESNPWAVPRILLNHIRPNNPQKETELLAQGSFSPNTLSLITDEQFSKDIVNKLDPFLKQVGFTIIKQLPVSNRAEIVYRLGLVRYVLNVQYSSLVDAYGIKLFNEHAPVMSAQEFIDKHQIELATSEYDKAIGLIGQYLPHDVAFDDEVVDEFAFLLIGDGMYLTLQMAAIIKNLFSKALVGRQDKIVEWAQQMKAKKGEPISGLKSRKNNYRRSYATTKEFI